MLAEGIAGGVADEGLADQGICGREQRGAGDQQQPAVPQGQPQPQGAPQRPGGPYVDYGGVDDYLVTGSSRSCPRANISE